MEFNRNDLEALWNSSLLLSKSTLYNHKHHIGELTFKGLKNSVYGEKDLPFCGHAFDFSFINENTSYNDIKHQLQRTIGALNFLKHLQILYKSLPENFILSSYAKKHPILENHNLKDIELLEISSYRPNIEIKESINDSSSSLVMKTTLINGIKHYLLGSSFFIGNKSEYEELCVALQKKDPSQIYVVKKLTDNKSLQSLNFFTNPNLLSSNSTLSEHKYHTLPMSASLFCITNNFQFRSSNLNTIHSDTDISYHGTTLNTSKNLFSANFLKKSSVNQNVPYPTDENFQGFRDLHKHFLESPSFLVSQSIQNEIFDFVFFANSFPGANIEKKQSYLIPAVSISNILKKVFNPSLDFNILNQLFKKSDFREDLFVYNSIKSINAQTYDEGSIEKFIHNLYKTYNEQTLTVFFTNCLNILKKTSATFSAQSNFAKIYQTLIEINPYFKNFNVIDSNKNVSLFVESDDIFKIINFSAFNQIYKGMKSEQAYVHVFEHCLKSMPEILKYNITTLEPHEKHLSFNNRLLFIQLRKDIEHNITSQSIDDIFQHCVEQKFVHGSKIPIEQLVREYRLNLILEQKPESVLKISKPKI